MMAKKQSNQDWILKAFMEASTYAMPPGYENVRIPFREEVQEKLVMIFAIMAEGLGEDRVMSLLDIIDGNDDLALAVTILYASGYVDAQMDTNDRNKLNQ